MSRNRSPAGPLQRELMANLGSANGQYQQGSAPSQTTFPPPIPASALKIGDPNADWFWHGYVSRHAVTLFSSLWKAGKTTMLAHLLRAFGEGGVFCGRTVRPARVLYVTEEPESMWARRRDRIGIRDHAHFQVRPFKTRPTMVAWVALLEHLRKQVDADGFDLVTFDPLTTLWPVEKENEAGPVADALMPLQILTEKAGVFLSHHFRKSGGEEATGARGSGALPGFVDTIMELRRYAPGDRKDRRRVISGYGRFEETPEEIVIELTADGSNYATHGDKGDVKQRELSAVIAGILPPEFPGLVYDQIRESLVTALDDGPPGRAKILDALETGSESGLWVRAGEGVKGDPYRYWRPRGPDSFCVPPIYRAETETESRAEDTIPD